MAMMAKEWTVNGLAVELNQDRLTLGKKLAGLEPLRIDGDRKYYLMCDVYMHLMTVTEGKLDPQQEQAKLNQARRAKVELETKVVNGELCRTSDVEKVWYDHIVNAKTKLLSLPQKAAHQVLSVTEYAEAESILKTIIDECLHELSATGSINTQSDDSESVASAS